MKILLLAPHPFYQERGTPIAVNLLLEALSGLGHTVDVLTYHEGSDKTYPGVTLHRIQRPPLAHNVPPGPSLKKIICDLFMYPHAMKLARTGHYDLVHAVEESVYMAMRIKRRFGTPYLYDMDSSLARQIAEKFTFLKWLRPLLSGLERSAIRGALGVVPVCDALAEIAFAEGARKIVLLRDISLLEPSPADDIAAVRALIPDARHPRFMYIGNLETYQGADLMLEGFAHYARGGGQGRLLIVGGKSADIKKYKAKAEAWGVGDAVLFLGPQPLRRMAALFDAADILLSPRISGNNTPMKIYSYLASGKAILATALPTHTQVLTESVALLVKPDPKEFGEALARLAGDTRRQAVLGTQARDLAIRHYSPSAFRTTVAELYHGVESVLSPQ